MFQIAPEALLFNRPEGPQIRSQPVTDEASRSDSRWYLAYTHPKQEERAANNFMAWEVKTYLPKFKEVRPSPHGGKSIHIIKPLFPRYIFIHVRIDDFYHKLRFTRGIHSLVSFGNGPCPVDDQIIKLMKSRTGPDGLIIISDEVRVGDDVVIKEGPLKHFTGVFERNINDSDRISVLLDTVDFQAHVVIEKEKVKGIGL